MPDLAIDPVDLAILILELAAHVDGHVPEIADHRVDLAHVILHLVFARVVRDLADVAAGDTAQAVALVHHPLGLVVDDFAVVVALPRALVLLEARAPAGGGSVSVWLLCCFFFRGPAISHLGAIFSGLRWVHGEGESSFCLVS